ncbi:viperin family antiviral radical SAM protein [Streptomyces sp. NPDC002564]|uniref:viperin family antiviral radical SAM protein n=1 Tax=Streptomyces sp. NPDC002564 TaxID=3364649 RepID=UPI003678133C
MQDGLSPRPPVQSVNFHLWQPCNMHCHFCFARFKDVRADVLPAGHLPEAKALRVVTLLAEAGFQKLTFAGGEPFLCPWLDRLIARAHEHGMVTSVVSNGSLIGDVGVLAPVLDWLVLSIDSVSASTLHAVGRTTAGRPLSAHDYRSLCRTITASGIQLKTNTVVTRANKDEHLAPFIHEVGPRRWKILQMLPIAGQNGGVANPLTVTKREFDAYVERNAWVERHDITVVPEDNASMTASYAMIDPAGRFFDNIGGRYAYSTSILSDGVQAALDQITIDSGKYRARGGEYDWERAPHSPTRC